MRATIAGFGRTANPVALAPAPSSGGTDEKPYDASVKRACSPRRCVVEHQGMKFVHQSDGSIVCEPLSGFSDVRVATESDATPAAAPHPAAALSEVRRVLGLSVGMVMALGGYLGLSISLAEAYTALSASRPVDHRRIIKTVNEVVRCCVLGTLTGAVAAPASALFGIVRVAARPAILCVAVHGASRWVARHHIGAAAVLRKLQSGDLSRQLEALRQLVARLSASAPFCSQFKKLAGVEVLLKMLEDVLASVERGASLLGGPQAPLIVRALADLAKQGDAVNTMVDLGGIPLLLRAASCGLGMASSGREEVAGPPASPSKDWEGTPGNAAMVVHATAALARITSHHAVAQQLLASEPHAAPLVASLLEQATARRVKGATAEACDQLCSHAVALAQALALEPVGKAALGNAGGVEALSAVLMLSSPWTLGQATAAAALHALVRGDVDNQRRLASVAPAGLSAAINRALVAGGPAAASAACGGAAAPVPVPVSARSTAAVAQAVEQALVGLQGPAGRPLALQDCHAHRADLLALSNVINRFSGNSLLAAPVVISSRSGSSGCSSPTGTSPSTRSHSATAPGPAGPGPATLLQRLRLRTSTPKAANVPSAAAPVIAATKGAAAAAPAAAAAGNAGESLVTSDVAPVAAAAGPAEAGTADVGAAVTPSVEEGDLGSEDWECTVEAVEPSQAVATA